MIGQMGSAAYDPVTGTIIVQMKTSTITGYPNGLKQYAPYGIMSVPLPTGLVNQDRQASSQIVVTGYDNSVIDTNFAINPGEISLYSENWYNFTANAGIYMQPRGTANKENAMMGQSTNLVLKDMINLLIAIISYLDVHVHTGVTTGGGNSGPPLNPAPDDTDVTNDGTYISGNKNLAITGTYVPK